MIYKYKKPSDILKNKRIHHTFTDKQKHTWITVEKGNRIIGEIRPGDKFRSDDYIVDGDHRLTVTPVAKKKMLFQSCIGYLPCITEDDEKCTVAVYRYNWRRITAILVIALALCAGLLWGILTWYRSTFPTITKDDIVAMQLPDSMQNTDSGSYSIPDYTLIRKNIDNDKTDTWLFNVEGNPYDLAYEIYLKEDHQLLYRSPIIGAGEGIEGMTLYEDLPAGEYEYTLECKVYEQDSQTEIGVQTFEGVLEIYEE